MSKCSVLRTLKWKVLYWTLLRPKYCAAEPPGSAVESRITTNSPIIHDARGNGKAMSSPREHRCETYIETSGPASSSGRRVDAGQEVVRSRAPGKGRIRLHVAGLGLRFRLAALLLEETLEQRPALLAERAHLHLDAMVELRLVDDVEHRATGAGLG